MTAEDGAAPPRTRARFPGPALAAALLLGAAAAPPVLAREADERLRVLGEEFLAQWLSHAPGEATALGSHDRDDELFVVTGATLEADRAWAHGFRDRLAAIPLGSLDPERAIERDLLTARVDRMIAELDDLRPFERDPGAYVPLIGESVHAVLARAFASPCGRVRLAAHRLAQVPEVLRAARINLRGAPPALCRASLPRLEGVLRFYRETLPAMASECRDSRMQADLAQADTSAVRAVEAFVVDVRERGRAEERSVAVGPEGIQRWLDAALMEHVPLDTLVAEADRAIEAGREALSGPDGPATSGSADPERYDRAGLGEQLRRVPGLLGQLSVTGRTGTSVPGVRAAPEYESDAVRLDAPGPWESRSSAVWIELARADSIPRDSLAAPQGAFDLDRLVFAGVVPGRLARADAMRGWTSRLRRALQWSWPGDDWATYAGRSARESGFGAEDPAAGRATDLAALRLHGRTRAALGIMAGTMTLEQAGAMLTERCGLGAGEAALEARRAASDPWAMVWTHGALGLLALRDETSRRLGPSFRIKVFNDALLRYGGSPIGLVRAGVLRELGLADGEAVSGAKR